MPSMGKNKKKRRVKMKLNEISGADVSFISLVDRPASRVPFRVLKAEDENAETPMLNFTNGLTQLFKRDGEKATPLSSITSIVARKGVDIEALKPQLSELGLSVDDVVEEDSYIAFKQEDGEGDVIGMKVSDDLAIMVKAADKEAVSKSFSAYLGSVDFDENLKSSGFFPSLRIATDALYETVHAIALNSDSEEDMQDLMGGALSGFSAYVMSLIDNIPEVAFKMDSLVLTEKSEQPPEGDQGTDEGIAPVEEEASKEDAEITDADSSTSDADDSSGDSSADEEIASAPEGDEQETASKSDSDVLAAITALTEEFSSGIRGLKDEIETVSKATTEMGARMDSVEELAKKADDAVKGTVAGGDRQDEDATSTSEEVVKSDDVWSGSQLDRLAS